MIFRLAWSVVRALFVVVFIALPSVLLPGTTQDAAQIIALVAIFGSALTIFEYASSYPGLVEFRDAPPFNRIRFGSIFISVLLLTMIARGLISPGYWSGMITDTGTLIGNIIDFPYSPVRLVVLMLPDDATVQHVDLVRAAAGLSFLVSLLTLALFLIFVRITGWPLSSGTFNVWVNLPTFDPTAGGDVVERLERDARFNIALGFLFPFVMPAIVKSASSLFAAVSLDNPQTLIWTVAAWAFLPTSLFMRGIAMARIAHMIEDKRKQALVGHDSEFSLV